MVVSAENRNDSTLRALAVGVLWLAWQAIRWPVFALLVVLEPIVRISLSTFALLGTLCALLFRLVVHRPQFPFWGMLAVSLSCVGMLALYYASLRWLSAHYWAGRPSSRNRGCW